MGQNKVHGVHTAETLEAVVSELGQIVLGLKSRALSMREHKIGEVTIVRGHKEMTRGLAGLLAFNDYAEQAITKAREDRGDFGASVTPTEPLKS